MLEYVALFLVFMVIIVLFYGIIVVHDIPYEIAVHRQHPHQDAIHVAGWISLFTLGAIWPFLWIWATLYKPGVGWGMQQGPSSNMQKDIAELKADISSLKKQLAEKGE